MARNTTVGFPTHRLKATYGASTAEADYPATNLGSLPLCRPCRSTGVANPWELTATFATKQVIQFPSLWATNVSVGVKNQVQVFDAPEDADDVEPVASGSGANTVVLHPLIGFERSGQASYIGVTGLTIATANDPRFARNPLDGTVTGLLIEGSAQNIILQSDAMTVSPWSAYQGATITGSAHAGIDNTVGLCAITAPTAGTALKPAAHLQRTALAVASAIYTFEVDVFADTVPYVAIAEGGDFAWHEATFDLSTGGVAGTNSVIDTDLTDLGGGLYRAAITFQRSTSGTMDFYIGPKPDPAQRFAISYDPAGESIFAGRVHCSPATYAGSYIKTTSAAVTRNAEFAKVASLGGMGFNAARGTVYVEVTFPGVVTGDGRIVSFSDGSSNNQITLFAHQTTLTPNLQIRAGGSTVVDFNTGVALDPDLMQRIAFRYAEDDVALCGNGGTVANDTSATMPAGLTVFGLGCWHFGSNQANAIFQRVVYWPDGLTDAQLQSITNGGELPNGYSFYADFREYQAPTVAVTDGDYDLFVRSESGYEWREVTVMGGSYTVEPILGDTKVEKYAFFDSGALTARQKAAYATSGRTVAPIYDTGLVAFFGGEFPESQVDWDGGRWWDRSFKQEEIEGDPRHMGMLLDEAWYGRAVRWVVDDSTNPDEYIETGFFDVAAATVLAVNPALGAAYGFRGRTEVQEAHGGTKSRERRRKPRTFLGELDAVSIEQSHAVFFEMQRQLDVDVPVFWSIMPDDVTLKNRLNFPAHFVKLDNIVKAQLGADRVPIPLEEEL